ncbi:MAG: 3-deoxy-manno-octulosonate-8-phosphatase KdsC [Legionellales bacterium]|nr:3-deoxy-manno-octulosonate-8-phosphatase KdsC [Legionellales bacterium]
MEIDLLAKARAIKLLILDIDGVMSDGRIIITDAADEIKSFFVQDELGIQLLLENGIEVAVISGRSSPLVAARMKQLKISLFYQGQSNKIAAYEELIDKLKLSREQTAHVGDDLPDIALFNRVGLAISVANGVPLAKRHAHWVTEASGGAGAVREVCDLILNAQDKWKSIEERFIRE